MAARATAIVHAKHNRQNRPDRNLQRPQRAGYRTAKDDGGVITSSYCNEDDWNN
jgi:hypothetical protein